MVAFFSGFTKTSAPVITRLFREMASFISRVIVHFINTSIYKRPVLKVRKTKNFSRIFFSKRFLAICKYLPSQTSSWACKLPKFGGFMQFFPIGSEKTAQKKMQRRYLTILSFIFACIHTSSLSSTDQKWKNFLLCEIWLLITLWSKFLNVVQKLY